MVDTRSVTKCTTLKLLLTSSIPEMDVSRMSDYPPFVMDLFIVLL